MIRQLIFDPMQESAIAPLVRARVAGPDAQPAPWVGKVPVSLEEVLTGTSPTWSHDEARVKIALRPEA